MSDPGPRIRARQPAAVRDFLADPDALSQLVADFGTPVNIVFPEVFRENAARLGAVFSETPVAHRLCYAHKVNQSRAFVATAHHIGLGIDIASPRELRTALATGFSPDAIEATGPKGLDFLGELVREGVTINVDNLWELGAVAGMASAGRPVRILLRVCGFPDSAPSRFGIHLADIDAALSLVAEAAGRLDLLGFAFHLDTADTRERIRALVELLGLVDKAGARGMPPAVVDIGGGLRQVFVADGEDFDRYDERLRRALTRQAPRMTWANNTFGYQVTHGVVRGVPVFHKYGNTVPADRALAELLRSPLPEHAGRTVSQVVADNLLTLWLEPGKALVDGAGITVARVLFTKKASEGSVVVQLDISRDALTPADQEVLVDPVVIPGDGGRRPEDPVGVFFGGRLCLERDVITARTVYLPWLPRSGDLVVFANTAAYHMDLSAATAAGYPLAPKVAVIRGSDGFVAIEDEHYATAVG